MNYYDNIKLEIYEAYDNGEISYNEKEYLLEEVNEVIYEDTKDVLKGTGIGAALGAAVGAATGYIQAKAPTKYTVRDLCIRDFRNTSEAKAIIRESNRLLAENARIQYRLDDYLRKHNSRYDTDYEYVADLHKQLMDNRDRLRKLSQEYDEKLDKYLDEHMDDPKYEEEIAKIHENYKTTRNEYIKKNAIKGAGIGAIIGAAHGYSVD